MKTTPPGRFDVLDGLRGVAALIVMICHYTQHNGLVLLGGAWVAVDLFFILSGFVIAHSYGKRIADGLEFRRFVLIRLIRLGPLYVLGLMIGVVAVVLALENPAVQGFTRGQVASAFWLGLAGLPYFNDGRWPFGDESVGGAVFPLNDPAWSLFFELFVNGLFFWVLSRFRGVSLGKIVILASAVFVLCSVGLLQVNPGWGGSNFIFGFPRVIAEFFGGTLIYSTGLHRRQFSRGVCFITGFLALLGVVSGNRRLVFFDSITLIPMTVVVMSGVQVEGVFKTLCGIFGKVSYPLYILHYPIYRVAFLDAGFKQLNPVAQTFLVSVVSVTVSLLMVPVDSKLRRWLTNRLGVAGSSRE